MKQIFQIGLIAALCFFLTTCVGPVKEGNKQIDTSLSVGGPFENNEFMYYGIPKTINAVDTSAGWNLPGQKLLITGTVYEVGGKTVAPDVLLYYYQTNTDGKYLHLPEESRSMPPNKSGQTHGYIRGWVKTDQQGKYYIYTVRPGVYPTNDEPAHIHISVKEPNDINEYYIDDFVFDDDNILTSDRRNKMENRGGSGILKLVQRGEWQMGERNIVLGLHIPFYPKIPTDEINPERKTGEDIIDVKSDHTITLFAGKDGLTLSKAHLTKIYVQAIETFIKGAYKNDKTTFDTLYFGKHIYGQPEDFPDIYLPETIKKVHISVVTHEVGHKKQRIHKSLVYINMMGWIDKEKAEFIFVVFSNHAEHQYDYYINFFCNKTTGQFVLDKIEFESYLNQDGKKPARIAVFSEGKYVK